MEGAAGLSLEQSIDSGFVSVPPNTSTVSIRPRPETLGVLLVFYVISCYYVISVFSVL
jgi:hypothetical protein